MAELDQLVPDIYKLLDKLQDGESIVPDLEPHLDTCMENIRECIVHWATPQERDRSDSLRMSNIGRGDRRLWFDAHEDSEPTREPPHTFIKFLYGHLLEQIALLLVEAAGHRVSNTQDEVVVDGIKGHMDAVIDGEVVDVKTASSYGFKKFAEGRLAEDDAFGYLPQLAGYEKAMGTDNGGFLVINKESGELCLHIPDDLDKPNVSTVIEHKKNVMKSVDEPEALCYDDKPNGAAGNMTVGKGCTWGPHLMQCRSDANDGKGLRVLAYSKGPEFFTKVVKEPRVEEITHEFV